MKNIIAWGMIIWYMIRIKNEMELETGGQVKAVCDRNFGIGSDGILVGPVLAGRRCENPGSEAEKSGNGMGIFARYLEDAGSSRRRRFPGILLGGEVTVYYLNEEGTRVKISMGKPTFWSDEIPVTGERREMVNQTMVFGKIPYITTCLFYRQSPIA